MYSDFRPKPKQKRSALLFGPQVGVVCYDSTIDIHVILACAIARMEKRGLHPAGLLQSFGDQLTNGKRSMWLEDIATGERIRIDQPRGPGATACVLDTAALAYGATLVQRAVRAGAKLVFANRFGAEEASGRGMRGEIAEAVCMGAAVLIPVRRALLQDLERFLGEPATLVAPNEFDIADWAEDTASSPRH